MTVTSSTISDNSSSVEHGGGISASDGPVRIENSILARNTGGSAPDLLPGTGPLSVEYSLIGDNTGTGLTEAPLELPDANGNLIGGPINGAIDPLLGYFMDNGGPTVTRALLPGSPAIDAGDPNAEAGVGETPLFDQRGEPWGRVKDGDGDMMERIDMGAFEVQRMDGDFNDDDVYDYKDIDSLVFQIITFGDPVYDMTGDGLVNLDDRDAWLVEAGGVNLGTGLAYRLGDANLDSFVDVSDLNIWNANRSSPPFFWSWGNFNADSMVDMLDFNIWNENKFQGPVVLPGASDNPSWPRLEQFERVFEQDERVALEPQRERLPDASLPMRQDLFGEREYRARRQPIMTDNARQDDVLAVEAAFASWTVEFR